MFRSLIGLAVALLVIALVAALLGFGGLAGEFAWLAEILFFVLLVVAVLVFLGGFSARRWGT